MLLAVENLLFYCGNHISKIFTFAAHFFKTKIMTVITSKEFVTNQKKYFDMAVNEDVFIKRDNDIFVVTKAKDKDKNYLQPDDDLRRAITADVLLERIYKDIDRKFANRIK